MLPFFHCIIIAAVATRSITPHTQDVSHSHHTVHFSPFPYTESYSLSSCEFPFHWQGDIMYPFQFFQIQLNKTASLIHTAH
ncbi:outer membrane protein [Escherichia coli O45:H2]|nr:putative outer membrane protein [Escherichia coli Xuzhou21]AUF74499.1 outer membrane protein [Escherichia coli O121:H19]AUL84197.1 outer membrane protein [Escherichia coli]AWJ28810.1 outer membrane protein [Escherichia coli O121 str. RM8352]QCH83582.1 outer membrane protein [Escherichia coli O157:H7]QCH87819.1 outer membrane protein [Escherichia coli O45:H2]RBB46145.1 outer membrane protein [Escherichia coli O111:H-]